jgi:hypothetical protein
MATIGRNEACPCGSGKKFKKCHDGNWPEGSAATHDLGAKADFDLRTAAVHEAGHAVACAVLGRRFEEVSLTTMIEQVATPSGPAEIQSTTGVRFSQAYDQESLSFYRAGKLDVGDLLIALAGGAAEFKLAKARSSVEGVKQGMTWDFQNIGYAVSEGLQGADNPVADEEFVGALLSTSLKRAGVFVDANRTAIEAVAVELISKKSLSFEEVLALAKIAMPEAPTR